MPASVRALACREVSGDFTAILAARLESAGSSALEEFSLAAHETGLRAGERLKAQFRLDSSFADARLAWKIVSRASGMTFTVADCPGRAVFDHLSCPVLQAGGVRLCENFCLPMVAGLTQAICPSCGVEIVEPANLQRPCKKALVMKKDCR